MTRRMGCPKPLIAFATMLFSLAYAADLPKAEYTLREPVAATGSNIRKNISWGSQIPLNRTYQQMSDKEKAAVNSMYEHIAPGDEPPFPVDGLKPILLAIWKGQGARQVVGKLTLVADVDAHGDVTKVEIYDDPDKLLTKFITSVLFSTKFKPAICKGTPCRMQYPFSFDLRLE